MPSFTVTDNLDADKLPSLKQWIRSVHKEALEPIRIVKVVWLPNLYKSYTLDTEVFRLRIGEGQQLYQILEDHLDSWLDEEVVLALQIEGSKIPKVTLMTLDNEQCEWDALGDHGFKMRNLTAKKKPRNKTRSLQSGSTPVPAPSEPQEGASE